MAGVFLFLAFKILMKIRILFLLVLTGIPAITYSQQKYYKNEFGFRSDNDAYLAGGQDRYYTNGLFISFKSATDQRKLRQNINKKIWQAEIGQKIYNPQSGYIPDISYADRPFAGYLYTGGSLQWMYNAEHVLKVSLQIGTIGPASLARAGQELLHNTVGFYELQGWETQVNNEFGMNTSINYQHFLHRSASQKADFAIKSYVNIGNTFTAAGAGILFRTGLINQFYNSVSNGGGISNNPAIPKLTETEFYFYAEPSVNLVAYDATIQGGLFRDDKGPVVYDAKPVVFSHELGAMFAKKRWTVNLSLVFKSREVQSSARAHEYGSVCVYYRFN